MGRKKTLICMLLAVCLMWTFQPERASADGGSIMVNGVNILQAADHTVPCGAGSAVYDEGTNTLTLRNAEIGGPNHGGSVLIYGIEIQKEGVTVRLEGSNLIDAYLGIWSRNPIVIQGADGGSLAIRVSKNQELSVPCRGISVDYGGLTVRDANIRITMENLDNMSGYGIDICGGDNEIVNSQIEITGPFLGNEDQSVVGINGTGANSLTISNQSHITMPTIGRGADVSGKLTLSDSTMEIGSTYQSGISGGNVEIVNARLTASESSGLALQANEKITIVDSEVNVKSTGTNALLCGNLEVANSSLTANGYWPALFVTQNTVIRDSSVHAESSADVGIFNREGNLEITGSTVNAVSNAGNSGILTKGDLTISDSNIISPGNAGVSAIKATGSFSVTGGTTEIGAGSITAGGTMQIGGAITANGTVSFDNVHAGNGSVIFAGADYGAVDAAIAGAQNLKREDYTNFEIVDAAIGAVIRGKDFREQAVVDGYAEAVRAAVAALVPVSPIPVVEGADQTVEVGEGSGIVIKADWAFDKFLSVLVDGTEIGTDCYTAAAGSTIITLNPEYVNTLSPGNHIIGIRFTDGLAQTTLTLKEKEDSANPPDNQQPEDDSSQPGDSGNSQPESPGDSGNTQPEPPGDSGNSQPESPGDSGNSQPEPPEDSGSAQPEHSGASDNGSNAAPENGQPENASNPPAEPAEPLSQNLLPGQKILDKSPHTGDSAPVGWLLVLMAGSAMGMAAGRKRI